MAEEYLGGILIGGILLISSLLCMILLKLSRILDGVNDLNLKIGRIGIRQITSSVHYEDGTVKVSTDTTGEVNEIIRLLREIADSFTKP